MEHPANETWRWLIDLPQPGAWNMAIDEAILQSVSEGFSPPTLRFYAWEPACLSLGYGQAYRDIDESNLHKNGWDVVRRPTGGKAILHTDELTYSVCAGTHHPLMKGGILESYELISEALLHGLEQLAVPATREPRYEIDPEANPNGPVCFEIPSNWEITCDGKKLIGSAQVRRSNAVLQHGTLPLTGDLTRITAGLSFEDSDARRTAGKRLMARAVTASDALGKQVSWDEAARALRTGFEKALGIRLVSAPLAAQEEELALELVQNKYGNPAWTRRRT